MCEQHRRQFLARSAGVLGAMGVVGSAGFAMAQQPAPGGKKWMCPPCGCPSDGKEFDAPGKCPSCAMPLIEKPAAAPAPTPTPAEKPAAEPGKTPGAAQETATPQP
jgi:hypothetical protein